MAKKNNNYDIELILSNEDFINNRAKCLKQDLTKKKNHRLKRCVKNLLWFILGAIIGIIIYQFFTVETMYETPVGNYTCHGEIVKICSSSVEVANYLGSK